MPSDPSGGSNNLAVYIFILIFFVLFNAFFSMSEMAIVSLNDNKVRRMAQSGDKKAKKLLRLIDNPTNFLSTIQIGVTFSGAFTSAIAADTFVDMIVKSVGEIAIPVSIVRAISLILITLLISYFQLVFGELVPKRIAMQNYEKISFGVVGILSGMMTVLRPMVSLLSASTNGVLRLLRIDPNQKPEEVTEEEIRIMLDVGNESGHIEESEKDMIYNIFEFDDRTVEDVMAHRTEVVAVEINSSLTEIIEKILGTGYSRIPVYEEDLDNIVGILYVKDLLNFVINDESTFNIRDFMREPMFVIESTSCRNLLAQFQATTIQLAIVVDEYGGTAGLVSMEDLLESIVGNIKDEYDDEEEDIVILSETDFIVDGLADFEQIVRFFSLNIDEDVVDDFDTIGGYVTSLLGQIPSDGEFPSVTISNVDFTVKEMNERRIAKLSVKKLHTELDESEEDNPKKKNKKDNEE